MKKSGIPAWPSLWCTAGKPCTPRGSASRMCGRGGQQVDPDTVFQLASLSKPLGATVVAIRSGRTRSAGTPRSCPNCRGLRWPIRWSPRWSPSATCTRTVRACPTTPATCSRISATTGATYSSTSAAAAGSVPNLLRLHQLRVDRRGGGGGGQRRKVVGGPGEEVLYRPLGMTSTSSRFADFEARPNRAVGHIHVDGNTSRAMSATPPRSAGRRGQLVGERHDALDGHGAGQRQLWRPTDRRPEGSAARGHPANRVEPGIEPAMRSGFYGYGFNVGTTSAARMELSHSGAFELGAAPTSCSCRPPTSPSSR